MRPSCGEDSPLEGLQGLLRASPGGQCPGRDRRPPKGPGRAFVPLRTPKEAWQSLRPVSPFQKQRLQF